MIPTRANPPAAPLFAPAALLCFLGLSATISPCAAEDVKPGLIGEYLDVKGVAAGFQDVPPEAKTSLVRIDRQINFPSTTGEFHGSKLTDDFVVRWSGILRIPQDGSYNLWVESDDGSRLFLNEERIVDNWSLHAMSRSASRRDLKAGDYNIRILYFEAASDAGCILGWDPPEGGQSGPVPAAHLFHYPSALSNAQNRKAIADAQTATPKASIDRGGEQRRFGLIFLEGDKIVVGESSGAKVPIDPAEVTQIEFTNPEWDRPKSEEVPSPQPTGPLAAPWKHAVAGKLISGASAHGKDGLIEVFTSARHPDEKFSAFSMAYCPAPAVGHITARITKIENTSWDSIAGVILRDGTGTDAGNIMLSIRPTGGAAMRDWKSQGGSTRSDSRGDLRPPYWLRIIHDGRTVAGLTSPDGRSWRKLWDVPEKFESKDRIFGLIASGREGEKPWAATFDNVSVGSLEEADAVATSEPRTYLTDGSIIRGPITSSDTGKLIRFGAPWNRTIPALYVDRIDFFHPMSNEIEERLSKMRPGVLLTIGDFLEASFESLQPELLTVTSSLFGKKELRPGTEADSIILRESGPATARRAAFKIETWDGQIFFARKFSVADGKFVFDAPYLGKPAFAPDRIRRISPSHQESP